MNNQLKTISLDLIDPNPDNPRKDLSDLTELADSIKAQGIQQAPVVTPAKNGRYMTVIGHRRLAAARLAGLSQTPCIVRHYTKRAAAETMLIENTHRASLTALEEADGYQLLLDLGETVEQAAQKTGRAASTVRQRVRIASIDAKTRERMNAQPTLEQLDTISKYEGHPDLQEKLAEAVGTKEWTWKTKEAEREAAEREWWAQAKETLAQARHVEWELPDQHGWYNTPAPLRELTSFRPGKQQYAQQAEQWLGKHDATATHIGVRLEGAEWEHKIVWYEDRDMTAEREEQEQARREWERKQAERAAAERPVIEYDRTAKATRNAWLGQLARQKTLGKRDPMPLLLTAMRDMFQIGIDSYDEEQAEAELTTSPQGDDGIQATLLAAAWYESSIDWDMWCDKAIMNDRIRPYYNGLKALGYKPSAAETQALDGLYIDNDNNDDEDD
jgi:ParB family transcriptional regulator, chromosome partitioning protein